MKARLNKKYVEVSVISMGVSEMWAMGKGAKKWGRHPKRKLVSFANIC